MAAARAANSGGGGAKFSLLNRGSSKQDSVATGIYADEGRQRGSGGSKNPQLTMLPHASDIKWIDQFPYYPAYRYHSYRSYCGACSSILFLTILLLRFSSSIMDFVNRPPIVTEAREQFERDSTITYRLPRVGVQFRQNGWRPFNDPRYLSIIFEQGVISIPS